MQILSSTTSFLGSHIYYVIEDSHAVIIDPADKELIDCLVINKHITVDYSFLTHEHCDHSYGCDWIRNQYNSPIYSSLACSRNLKNERRNQSRYYEAFATVQVKLTIDNPKEVKPFSTETDITFEGEMRVQWEGHEFYLRETPGHSEGSICILLDNKYLFSGDSLMWNELTNTRFPGGNRRQFEEVTLPWLKTLNPDIWVYPGHLQEFRLGDRLENPII